LEAAIYGCDQDRYNYILIYANNNNTYLLIPWCRILFEKLIVTQLLKKYPAFL
jgi:hypothetical protein